jgi:hypothetical protein
MNIFPSVSLPSNAQRAGRALALTLGLTLSFSIIAATAVAPKTFDSPQAASAALANAVGANDEATLLAIFGSQGSKLLDSGDAVEDQHSRETFSAAYAADNKVVMEDDSQATLVIGKDEWPMPIPLIKGRSGWRFDTAKGEQEILTRRIGRNEMESMQVCAEIVDAEHEYAALHVDADGVPVYAARFASHAGKRDGLYWPTPADEPSSPLGVLLATAADEGYSEAGVLSHAPYHGYYFRILSAQGKGAPEGMRDYMVNGKMIGGFAVIAYPASYGVSGVTSFLVNHDGVIYEKDLGAQTSVTATAMKAFDPAGWSKQTLTASVP